MAFQRRPLRIVQPRLQWRLILAMAGVSVVGMLLQYVLFVSSLADAAAMFAPAEAELLVAETGARLRTAVVLSLALVLPTTLLVGVLTTRRFAGPIYRFERYLRDVLAGSEKGPCRLRTGDDLGELCDLINRSTEPMRNPSAVVGAGAFREAA